MQDTSPTPNACGAATISFAYGRVSSRANGGSGVSRQEQSIEIQDGQFQDYIRATRIPPESFGVDAGGAANFQNIFLERHSGFNKKGDIRKRPEGARLWAAILQSRELHPTAAINLIFTRVDRIGRDWLETMILMRDLRDIRVRMHILMLGGQSFDCESPTGQLTVSILAWQAQNEVKNTQSRIQEGINHKRDNDELLNGCAPYGWDAVPTGEVRVNKGGKPVTIYRLVPNEREQKWILHMLALRNGGWGYRAIATDLNRRGVPTKRGIVPMTLRGVEMKTSGKWRFGGVAKVLNNKTTQAWLTEAGAARTKLAA
jgi:DNA invertase Pin-like site-specific DNA recombinase